MDVISIMCAQSAEDYFEKIESLAEDGNAAAQCGLGTMYINGTFVDKDEDKAMEWFEKIGLGILCLLMLLALSNDVRNFILPIFGL